MSIADALIEASRTLARATDGLAFGGEVTHVYNPLHYARDGWERYLHLGAGSTKRIVLLGMNPGPWGMAQTGVPFGEITAVREWMGIEASIGSPTHPHPKRPIEGFACTRSEVSGRRLWGLMQARFGPVEAFFHEHFVANYCPLAFMAQSGRNITPDKLSPAERDPLFALCDEFLTQTIRLLEPDYVIGVGKFAESRIRTVLSSMPDDGIRSGVILHPSPASPAANRDWAGTVTAQLEALDAW